MNWSEVARRAITREALSIKAEEEGLTREEVLLLIEMEGIEIFKEKTPLSEEVLQSILKEREKRRIERLRQVGI